MKFTKTTESTIATVVLDIRTFVSGRDGLDEARSLHREMRSFES
jgi:hypothetical protein